MSGNAFTTMRVTRADKKRFRGYAIHGREPDDQVFKRVLDKILELDEEIIELNKKLEHRKEDY